MTTPTIMIKSTITTGITTMTGTILPPSLWGILVGCERLLLTGIAVGLSLWRILVGCGMLLLVLGGAIPVAADDCCNVSPRRLVAAKVGCKISCGRVVVGDGCETVEIKRGLLQNET